MARDFTKVSPAVWTSKRFRSLPDDQCRLGYLYLLTGKHQNNAGISSMPVAYLAYDCGWQPEVAEHVLAELESAKLVIRDTDTEEVMITGWFKHNRPMNQKHRKGIVHTIERVESARLAEIGLADLEAVSPEDTNEDGAGTVVGINGRSTASLNSLYARRNGAGYG